MKNENLKDNIWSVIQYWDKDSYLNLDKQNLYISFKGVINGGINTDYDDDTDENSQMLWNEE